MSGPVAPRGDDASSSGLRNSSKGHSVCGGAHIHPDSGRQTRQHAPPCSESQGRYPSLCAAWLVPTGALASSPHHSTGRRSAQAWQPQAEAWVPSRVQVWETASAFVLSEPLQLWRAILGVSGHL